MEFRTNKLLKIFPIIILVAAMLMCVGYASINSVSLNVSGLSSALRQEGVYIVDAKVVNSSISDGESAKVKNVIGTNFTSNTVLANFASSEVTYEITVYNSSSKTYYFNEVKLLEDEITYSNKNIGYKLNNVSHGDILTPTGSDMAYKTFTITFYYKDGSNIVNNDLNSMLNFHFEEFYNIDYINVKNSDSYPEKIVKGGTLSISLYDVWKSELVVKSGSEELIVNTDYSYDEDTGILTIPNIVDNIIIFVSTGFSEYTVLDYITSDGNQFIDTGVNGRTGLKSDITVEFNNLGAQVDDYGILGARKTSSEAFEGNSSGFMRTYLLHYYRGFAHGYGMYYNSNILLSNNKKYTVHSELNIGDQFVSVDNTKVTNTNYTQSINLGLNLYLFAINQDGSPHYQASINLYHCRIYDESDNLIRDFIPVMRNSDGEIGLYDLVERKFYQNGGTGKFTGSVAQAKYTYITYVKSTGTQYIDTGVVAKSGLSSEMTLEIENFNEKGDFGILGARNGNTRIYLLHYYQGFTYGYGDYYSMNKSINTSTKYTINTKLNIGSQELKYGSQVLSGSRSDNINLGYNLYLFGINDTGSVTYLSPTILLYECKIYDNGKLIRHFKPAMRNSNFAVGLYDEVNKVFYTSLSDDAFIGE